MITIYKSWGPRFKLLVAFVFTYVLSLAFLSINFFITAIESRTVVYLDCIFALLLLLISVGIHLRRKKINRQTKATCLRFYKAILVLPILLIAAYLLFPSLPWENLVISSAWRLCLLSILLEDLVDIYHRHRRKSAGKAPVLIH